MPGGERPSLVAPSAAWPEIECTTVGVRPRPPHHRAVLHARHQRAVHLGDDREGREEDADGDQERSEQLRVITAGSGGADVQKARQRSTIDGQR